MASIDELDRNIIAQLKKAPRSTNRSLARELGLSEPKVAQRISNLEQHGVLCVMATVNMRTLGFEQGAVVGIHTEGRHPDDIAAELIQLPEVWGVNCTFGRYQLVVTLLARDTHHLLELVSSRIGTISGVQDMESCLVLDASLMRSDSAMLSTFNQLNLGELPTTPNTKLDELDLGIITALQEQGRMSFREVGRRLSAPEATIRSRFNRLEKTGAMRLYAVTDIDTLMPERSSAWIALRTHGGKLETLAQALSDMPDSRIVSITLGRFNLLALLVLPTRRSMLDLLSKIIATYRGIHQVEVWEIVHSYKHDIRISPRFH